MLLEERRRAHEQTDRRDSLRRGTAVIVKIGEQRRHDADSQQALEIKHDIAINRLLPGEDSRSQQTRPYIARQPLRQRVNQARQRQGPRRY